MTNQNPKMHPGRKHTKAHQLDPAEVWDTVRDNASKWMAAGRSVPAPSKKGTSYPILKVSDREDALQKITVGRAAQNGRLVRKSVTNKAIHKIVGKLNFGESAPERLHEDRYMTSVLVALYPRLRYENGRLHVVSIDAKLGQGDSKYAGSIFAPPSGSRGREQKKSAASNPGSKEEWCKKLQPYLCQRGAYFYTTKTTDARVGWRYGGESKLHGWLAIIREQNGKTLLALKVGLESGLIGEDKEHSLKPWNIVTGNKNDRDAGWFELSLPLPPELPSWIKTAIAYCGTKYKKYGVILTSESWEGLATSENAFELPDEAVGGLREGAITTIKVNAYERNPVARAKCIAHYGPVCAICGFSFAAQYGPLAKGFIHVHHINQLSKIGTEHEVDPILDLRPVCPNCHSVIHLGGECRSIQEVTRLRTQIKNTS